MKTRDSFVANSSSTSFMIKNLSDKKRNMADFVNDIGEEMIIKFMEEYNYPDWDVKERFKEMKYFAKDADYYKTFKPNESKICTFGDEGRNTLGLVFDYMLRDGGYKNSWSWRFYEYLR